MSPDRKRAFASTVPVNRVPWFDVLVTSGTLDEWLGASDPETFRYAVNIIEQPEILRRRGDEVAKRLTPLLEKKDLPAERKQMLLRLFSFDWFHGNESLFAIFIAALRRGEFENSTQDGGMRFYNLAEQYPDRAILVLEAIFDRTVERSPDGKTLDFDRFRLPENFVGQIISHRPKQFASAFLPRLVGLMQKNERPNENLGLTDNIWPILMYGMGHDLKWILLDRLAESLEVLAAKEPERFDKLTAGLKDSKLRNVAFLLLSGWSANPQQFADHIVDYLLQHPEFLSLGYSSWGEGNGEAAIARAAVSSASKFCSEANLRKLETAILNHYPPYEKEEPRRFGYIQALLLHAIDATRISQTALTRKEQLDRKFPKLNTEPPSRSGAVMTVPSPIPPTAVPKMTDENWLSAMRQYGGGSENDPARWISGGVHELSRQLEIATRLDKPRFAQLVLKMDDHLDSSYFDAVIRGLVTLTDEQKNNAPLPALDSPALFAAFLHINNLQSRPSGRWLASSIAAVGDRDLPKEILDIVAFHAIHGRSPEKSGAPREASHGADLVNSGINTVRGAAADALAILLFRKPERWETLKDAVIGVTKDKSWSVQAVSVSCLTALLNIDRNLAVSMFIESFGENDAILGSMMVPRFLQYASQTHYTALRDVLVRMLNSKDKGAREASALAIAIASFRVKQADDDLALVRKAPEDARAAWAGIAENNLRFGEATERCRRWLEELFFDESPKVRDIASRCFHKLSSDQLCAEVELIDKFIESPAFEHAANFLLMALERAVDRLPGIVCRIPERALELFRAQKDRVHRPWWTHQMSTLILRLYNQTRDPEIRRRCLDGIDSMIELGVGEVGVELEKIERV